jgi:hypothetical protein
MPGQSEQPKQRGAVGGMPTKVVRVKPGKASSPDWHDCVVEIDGMPPHDVEAVVDVRGGVQLHNVVLCARLAVEGDSELVNVWAGAAAGLQRGYAVPVLASDPDMQVENNHKALQFRGGNVQVHRLSLQNNDDCLQLGGGVRFWMGDSTVRLVDPFLGDHRDALDVDDVPSLELSNCEVRGSGNSAFFAKQEPGSGAVLGNLVAHRCAFWNQTATVGKRQGHMVWLGAGVERVELVDCTWDARPVQTLLIARATRTVVLKGNVYANDAPPLSQKRGAVGRKRGQEIEVTYFQGV